ncbi:TniQ family protein [Streptomyces sp. NPDC046716]|uniref:TniQ family protein n=1 Tax=Streptomyces sp. NPDC046716 TaxID=3157093 RepID=UPI0033FE4CFF
MTAPPASPVLAAVAPPPPRARPQWPCPPGVLCVRPLPGETTASYLARLAAAYHLTTAQLLDGHHITVTGSQQQPPTAELHLNHEAVRRLSCFTQIPQAHLAYALPGLHPPPPSLADGPHPRAHARWQALDPALQPLPACTSCTAHRTRSRTAAPPAWTHPAPGSPRLIICIRHQQAAGDPRLPAPLDTRPAPEIIHTHRRAHRASPASMSWATAITTRWYDHRQHLHQRWRQRLETLLDANPHIPHTPASPTLTCRNLITYPETLTLAKTLDQLPPHPLTHTHETVFLHHLAHRLHLHRLAPADHDLLWQRLR